MWGNFLLWNQRGKRVKYFILQIFSIILIFSLSREDKNALNDRQNWPVKERWLIYEHDKL